MKPPPTHPPSSAGCVSSQSSLRDFLARVPESRQVLANLGMDLTNEARSLAAACAELDLDASTVARLLEALTAPARAAPAMTLELMSLSQLCDHFETVHHTALQEELQRLGSLLPPIAGLARIRARSEAFRQKILRHLQEEAEVLFPIIRNLDTASPAHPELRNRLKTPLEQMRHEHNAVDEELAALQAMEPDDDASTAPLAHFHSALARLEILLHGQIYQENQILFRRASALLSSS
jgi:regulator of cell morphogenesis and NO signaling